MFFLPVAEIKRTAAMREPAHDDLVAANHLLAIDAEVLAVLIRAARDRESPGDQRSGVARPAGLDRELREIDVLGIDHHLLTGRVAHHLRGHIEHLLESRQLLPQILKTLRRLGLLQKCEQLTDVAQGRHRIRAHAERDALRRAEQVAKHRNAVALRVLEQQRRAFGAQGAIADLGHLKMRVDSVRDALELATRFELRQEIAEVRHKSEKR